MRFLGNIDAKTDTKGRAFLPATFRKVLNASGEESLILRKDIFDVGNFESDTFVSLKNGKGSRNKYQGNKRTNTHAPTCPGKISGYKKYNCKENKTGAAPKSLA